MCTFREITADELFQLMADAPFLLIDVRHAHELVSGVITGALHVPLAMIPVQYQAFTQHAGNIIFYCQSGVRSAHAAAYVSSKGRNNAYALAGGILAWQNAGYPLAKKT